MPLTKIAQQLRIPAFITDISSLRNLLTRYMNVFHEIWADFLFKKNYASLALLKLHDKIRKMNH